MLNKEEYSKIFAEIQDIWKKELKSLEACSVQAMINGDQKSIENGKIRAQQYKIIKNTVDDCINIILKYTKWDKNEKTI